LKENDDSWTQMEKRWHQFDAKGLGYIGYGSKMYGVYAFEPVNPYLEIIDPLPEAYSLLDKKDSLNALLVFEAVVQKNVNDSDAWCQLGLLQSEYERDSLAIPAFKRALTLMPSLLPAWMGLAISYTNEICKHDAVDALKEWIQHHPQYSVFLGRTKLTSSDYINDLIRIFLDIARSTANSIDADIQLALGLLFFIKGHMDYAIDCFNAALQQRPQVRN
jgi:peroxin-5